MTNCSCCITVATIKKNYCFNDVAEYVINDTTTSNGLHTQHTSSIDLRSFQVFLEQIINCFVLEFKKQVPETFAVYSDLNSEASEIIISNPFKQIDSSNSIVSTSQLGDTVPRTQLYTQVATRLLQPGTHTVHSA